MRIAILSYIRLWTRTRRPPKSFVSTGVLINYFIFFIFFTLLPFVCYPHYRSRLESENWWSFLSLWILTILKEYILFHHLNSKVVSSNKLSLDAPPPCEKKKIMKTLKDVNLRQSHQSHGTKADKTLPRPDKRFCSS